MKRQACKLLSTRAHFCLNWSDFIFWIFSPGSKIHLKVFGSLWRHWDRHASKCFHFRTGTTSKFFQKHCYNNLYIKVTKNDITYCMIIGEMLFTLTHTLIPHVFLLWTFFASINHDFTDFLVWNLFFVIKFWLCKIKQKSKSCRKGFCERFRGF